jgi:hypothetical protein
MMRQMDAALTVVRLGYVVVGVAALVWGSQSWVAAESQAGLVLLGGVLAVAAAAWVTSDGVVRGAIASVGIVAGACMVTLTSFLAAAFVMYFGDAARAALFAAPIPMALTGAWIMWRRSHRPWDQGSSA